MTDYIITISREYGSGGRTIGERAAQILGIPFYNRNLIDLAAHESGLDSSYITAWEEQVSSPVIWSTPVPGGSLGFPAMSVSSYYYSNEDRMYAAQSKIIRQEAKKGPCVIVGRCADSVLQDFPNVFRVFIYADPKIRLKRAVEEYGLQTSAAADKAIRTIDKGRAAYHRKYADVPWGECRSYNLCLDSGTLGLETCAQLIAQAVTQKE